MRLNPLVPLSLLGALVPGLTASAARQDPCLEGIRARDIQAHVDFLASDELQGRYAKSNEARIAARYVAACFATYGLEPRGDEDTWFQSIGEDFAPNVVGFVQGSSDECVVLSAHFDHLKPAEKGDDRIFNGADDNASGTAALLELAQAFGARPEPPSRSILFVAFTAEEMGLRGSYFFVDHAPVELTTLIGDINMDMVSRGEENLIFCEAGEGSEHLVEAARAHAEEVGLELRVGQHSEWIKQSDQYPFVKKKVPALYLGVEDHVDYHQVSDHADKILPVLTERVARLVYRMVETL